MDQQTADFNVELPEDGSVTTTNQQDLSTDNTIRDMSSSLDMGSVDHSLVDQTISDLSMTQDLDMEVHSLDLNVQTIDMSSMDMQITDMQTTDAMLTIDATIPVAMPEDCFPTAMNDNLSASSFFLGPHTNDTELCHEDRAAELDQQGAGLGYSGVRSTFVGQHEVSGCLVADFGRQCRLDDHVGIAVSMRAVADACAEETMNQDPGQCDVEGLCGNRPGASGLAFVASDLNDPRFLSRVGSCGEGYFFTTLTPIDSFAEVSTLEAVRYLMICRPRRNCESDQADLSIDALYLIWRQ